MRQPDDEVPGRGLAARHRRRDYFAGVSVTLTAIASV